MSCIAANALAQANEVSGKVKDARTAETMPGVSVVVKGTTVGTVTSSSGEFTLR